MKNLNWPVVFLLSFATVCCWPFTCKASGPMGPPGDAQPRAEQPRGMQPRAEQPRGMQPRGMQPRGMQPGAEQPRGMQPRGMQPMAVPQRAAVPRIAPPRAVMPRVAPQMAAPPGRGALPGRRRAVRYREAPPVVEYEEVRPRPPVRHGRRHYNPDYPHPLPVPEVPFAPPVVTVPVVVEQQPAVERKTSTRFQPQTQGRYWYYCDDPKGYSPYITACPSGWRKVTPKGDKPPAPKSR
jgi:hypothetical protein